ncbi:MAG TPA: outer membrane lipoprotein carrier protein LolA [Acidobacteriota bacterium]|nr:outer membrane lipoprotein carrier protein LolA [Acidobacteriota bacterium]
MKRWTALFSILFFLLSVVLAAETAPQEDDLTLDQVLQRLDERSHKVKSLHSGIEIKNWIKLLTEFDRPEKGEIWLLKDSGKTYFRRQIEEPHTNVLVVDGQEAVYYQPRIKQAVLYSLKGGGQKQHGVGNLFFALLTDRETLEGNYQVELTGREEIRGQNTYVLQLIPRDPQAARDFSKLVFYLSPQHWMPLRQTIHQSIGDYQQMDFTDLEINPKIDKNRFDLKLPDDVQRKRL